MAPAWAPGSGDSPCSAGLSPALASRGPQDSWRRAAGGRCRGAGPLTGLPPARRRANCALTAAIGTMTARLSEPGSQPRVRGMGSKSLRAWAGWRLPGAQRAVALREEEGVANGQECLPAELGGTGRGCPGKPQRRDLARHAGRRQVEHVRAFLLSRFFGGFVWGKQPLRG